VLAGPPVADSEDDEPRNTLLELVTSRVARDLGFSVSLTRDDEDVRLNHPGLGRGAIECASVRPSGTSPWASTKTPLPREFTRWRARHGPNLAPGEALGRSGPQ
jgi:hypothetical protein